MFLQLTRAGQGPFSSPSTRGLPGSAGGYFSSRMRMRCYREFAARGVQATSPRKIPPGPARLTPDRSRWQPLRFGNPLVTCLAGHGRRWCASGPLSTAHPPVARAKWVQWVELFLSSQKSHAACRLDRPAGSPHRPPAWASLLPRAQARPGNAPGDGGRVPDLRAGRNHPAGWRAVRRVVGDRRGPGQGLQAQPGRQRTHPAPAGSRPFLQSTSPPWMAAPTRPAPLR